MSGVTYHDSCVVENDIAVNNPIDGKATFRKINKGTWTRTIITADNSFCVSGGSGGISGMIYGPGPNGKGYLIRKTTLKEGGTRVQPDQTVLTWMGGFGKQKGKCK